MSKKYPGWESVHRYMDEVVCEVGHLSDDTIDALRHAMAAAAPGKLQPLSPPANFTRSGVLMPNFGDKVILEKPSSGSRKRAAIYNGVRAGSTSHQFAFADGGGGCYIDELEFAKGIYIWSYAPNVPQASATSFHHLKVGDEGWVEWIGSAHGRVPVTFTGYDVVSDSFHFVTRAGSVFSPGMDTVVLGAEALTGKCIWEASVNERLGPKKMPDGKVNCMGLHEWKTYLGFTDTFEYCAHCDKRKGT
jgi:hypothetical protein